VHLFVYGTLRSGSDNPHARRLAANATLLGVARVRGRLYPVGIHKAIHLSSTADEWVTGELWELREPAILSELDLYEGAEYRRVLTFAHLNDGRQIETWIYELSAPPREP
jgi:gamma-glutamylcyclotransferase (GGCT)/AIG2-like uncharacterized protein YtfP